MAARLSLITMTPDELESLEGEFSVKVNSFEFSSSRSGFCASNGKTVKEEVCRNRAIARQRMEPVGSWEEGFSTKRVIWLCGGEMRVCVEELGELETEGGYECSLAVLEVLVLPGGSMVGAGLFGGGQGFVRQPNSSEPLPACRVSTVGGESVMNAPGGKAGERIRRYQPRVGR